MKILLYIVSLLFALRIGYVSYINYKTLVDFTIFRGITVHTHFSFILLAIFIFGAIAGILFTLACSIKNKKALNEYKRELEKKTVSAENDSSKVKVLEAKIEVLEKALASALDKNKEN